VVRRSSTTKPISAMTLTASEMIVNGADQECVSALENP
jgi:hypothetical protein